MLLSVLSIPFYEQRRRIAPGAADAADLSVSRYLGGGLSPVSQRRGCYLLSLTSEQERGLKDGLARIAQIRHALDGTELGEHVCLLFESTASLGPAVEGEAERLLLRLEAASWSEQAGVSEPPWREGIVVHSSAVVRIRRVAEVQGDGEFAVLPPLPAQAVPRTGPTTPPPARGDVRPNATNLIVEAAFTSLQEEGSRYPVLVSGPDGVGKAASVLDAARRIMGEPLCEQAVCIHTLFGRKSAIHPYLNSLRPAFLEEVPRHLEPWERRVWEGREGILRALLWDAVPPREQDRRRCPDRLSVDFYSGYRLYLLAYTRAMEAHAVPALVVFEDIHSYHPEAVRFTVSLVRDMLRQPSFLPILTCRAGHDACGLFGTEVIGVPAHPVSLAEIREAAIELYPGLRLPEKAARRIRLTTGGRVAALRYCLRSLERNGKIRSGKGGYAWEPGPPARLPADALGAAWEEIDALDRAAKELLYLCALAGGTVPVTTLIELASSPEEVGSPDLKAAAAAMGARLRELAGLRLIRSAEVPAFLYPRLKGRLAEALGEWSSVAGARFADRIELAWRSGEARNLVLAFSVLRSEKPDVAVEILGELVTRKLDELNVRGCRFFLDPTRSKGGGAEREAEQRERYEGIAATGELRSYLLLGAWERAEPAMDRVTNLGISEERPREQAARSLGQARFHLVKADAPAAAKAAKAAVMAYHEGEDERGERRAEAELGAALLAEGRLEEALEYFGFVTRSASCDPFPRIVAASLSSVASYLLGNLSASMRLAEEGVRIAEEAGRREWQALLLFFRARQSFDLGQFDEAVSSLESLLCFSRIYGMQRAQTVATAWMGRSLAYGGKPAFGCSLLERLPDSAERRFFSAEGLFLQGKVQVALRLLESADTLRRKQSMPPGERVSWENGFASVEDRCVVLRREGGTLHRLIRGFRAYLTARDGRPEQAMRELYQITHLERIAEIDPYFPLYGYWYASTLPDENEGEGTDHKITILNRAMKHLQQRSSRIEKARDRWQLMTANYWNARLLEEAKARRLV